VLAEDGTMFEVTTFRKDVETDGRHAVVSFAERIEEDLARRDFTINAVAWHVLREELLDPYDGASDLRAGILRAVGVPAQRFAEDNLRVLRAIRFAGRFGLEVHPQTWDALCAATTRLPALSAERIRDELLKTLDVDGAPSTAMDLYRRSGALGVLYPELEAAAEEGDDGWVKTLRVIDSLPRKRPLLRLAALLRGLRPEHVAQVLTRLRLSNAQVDEAARIAGAPRLPSADAPDADFRRWLSRTSPRRLVTLCHLELVEARAAAEGGGGDPGQVVASWRRARAVRAEGPPLSVSDLALDGRDLIRLGLKPGPEFSRILDHLLDWVLEDPARNVAGLLAERATVEGRENGDRDE
jgi:tRNA nucleotidyltransferase (CCA-adding enzyme)